MPILTVENLVPVAHITALPGQTLLASIQASGLDWRHNCGGKGRCTTCRIRLSGGAEWLGPLTEPEEKFRTEGRLEENDRLCCQAIPAENATADALLTGIVPPNGRLPQHTYAD